MQETAGTRIEALARAKGLPEGAALAALLKVSYETLRKWREGTTAPNRNRAEQIASLLGVKSAVFMHGAEQDQPAATAPSGLTELEIRMLTAFRSVLNADRHRFVEEIEARAQDIAQIAAQISAESAIPLAASSRESSSRKRRAA